MHNFECESCRVDAFSVFEEDGELFILCEGCEAAYKLQPKGWKAEKISDGAVEGAGNQPGAVVSQRQAERVITDELLELVAQAAYEADYIGMASNKVYGGWTGLPSYGREVYRKIAKAVLLKAGYKDD